MPCYVFQGVVPVVDRQSWVHPLAVLIGDVIIGPGCYIGPGASLRGDFGRVMVEGDSSIQDNCTLHTSSDSDGATMAMGSTSVSPAKCASAARKCNPCGPRKPIVGACAPTRAR